MHCGDLDLARLDPPVAADDPSRYWRRSTTDRRHRGISCGREDDGAS
jgi:hypothetical protein